MSTVDQRENRTGAARWRRVGFIAICVAPLIFAIPILIIVAQNGLLFDPSAPAWPWLIFGPTVLVLLAAIAVDVLRHRRGPLPALDPTPRQGTVVSHRLQSTGDHSSRRVTKVEYRAADGEAHRTELLEELTAESMQAIPVGTPVELYVFQDPQYARTAAFLTETHDDLVREGAVVLWGVDRTPRFAEGPMAGSPFLGSDAGEVFASPAPSEPVPAQKPFRVSIRTTRVLVVVAWVVAGLAMVFATTSGFGEFSNNTDVGLFVVIAAFFVALGAMFLDGGTAARRGTLTRWSVLRLIGVSTLAIYVGVVILLIPAAWGLVRRLTGGATPRIEQQTFRNFTGLVLSTLLITLAVIGGGRLAWSSPLTSTEGSSGIGIGAVYTDPSGNDAVGGEVAYVPYRLDGMWSYQSRIAAVSLADGAVLWDRKIDSDPLAGYPATVTSIEPANDDPGAESWDIIVATKHGEFGFYANNGDALCGTDTFSGECRFEPGLGTLAAADHAWGDGHHDYGDSPGGGDLTDGSTVLDPATGEPAGDGFRIEYDDSVRIIVGDQVAAELEEPASLQQVLVAPSGAVVLLMDGDNRKSILVIASKDGFQQATIGDRGLIAWPAWMG